MAAPDLTDLPAGIYYRSNITLIVNQVRQCDSLECLVKNADVIKQRLLASGPADRKRIANEVIPLLENKISLLGDATGLINYGDRYMRFNEPEKALDCYKQALNINPLSVPALISNA